MLAWTHGTFMIVFLLLTLGLGQISLESHHWAADVLEDTARYQIHNIKLYNNESCFLPARRNFPTALQHGMKQPGVDQATS